MQQTRLILQRATKTEVLINHFRKPNLSHLKDQFHVVKMQMAPGSILCILLLPFLTNGWVTEMENAGLYQGDIILTPEQQEGLRKKGDFSFGSIKKYLWPGAVIPYSISPSLMKSKKAVNAIRLAIADYQKYTCLRFVKRTSERAHIYFFEGQGCSSIIGRTGGRNKVSLGSGCWARSTVLHEIGHAIGKLCFLKKVAEIWKM